jgi:hypothetical protein
LQKRTVGQAAAELAARKLLKMTDNITTKGDNGMPLEPGDGPPGRGTVIHSFMQRLILPEVFGLSQAITNEGLLDPTVTQELVDSFEGLLVFGVIEIPDDDRKCWTKLGLVGYYFHVCASPFCGD